MSKGLEALKRIENQFNQLGIKYKESGCHIREDDYFAIEKELKALQILKNKKVDMTRLSSAIKRCDLSYYNYYCYEPLTEEEYDLLKEVLL